MTQFLHFGALRFFAARFGQIAVLICAINVPYALHRYAL
jgi:hypothetical protein